MQRKLLLCGRLAAEPSASSCALSPLEHSQAGHYDLWALDQRDVVQVSGRPNLAACGGAARLLASRCACSARLWRRARSSGWISAW